MTNIHIIPINTANSAQFDALSKSYIDDTGCITLMEPASNAAVDAFILANSASALKAGNPIALPIGEGIIFSADPTKTAVVPTRVEKPAKHSTDAVGKQKYADYVRHARSLIIATVAPNGTFVTIDPRHNTAIFVRTAADQPWSIMRTEVIEKIKYIEDLLRHPKIKGLDTQLGIHTYEKNGVKTRVLTRFYKGHNTYSFLYGRINIASRSFVQAAPMYVLDASGVVHRRYTPEDFFPDKFQKIDAYHQSMELEYGTLVPAETKLLTLADLDLCRPFVSGDTHFVVYKNRRDRLNKAISGNFLQRDANGYYVIQDDDNTALDLTIDYINKQQTSVAINTNRQPTPSVDAWRKHKYDFVEKIEAIPEGVKIEFKNKSYAIDTGNQLTLHGAAENEHLKAMILHAKEHWGGQFQIDQASPEAKAILIRLAGEHQVTIVPISPTRPGAPQPNPLAGVQRAPAPAA